MKVLANMSTRIPMRVIASVRNGSQRPHEDSHESAHGTLGRAEDNVHERVGRCFCLICFRLFCSSALSRQLVEADC